MSGGMVVRQWWNERERRNTHPSCVEAQVAHGPCAQKWAGVGTLGPQTDRYARFYQRSDRGLVDTRAPWSTREYYKTPTLEHMNQFTYILRQSHVYGYKPWPSVRAHKGYETKLLTNGLGGIRTTPMCASASSFANRWASVPPIIVIFSWVPVADSTSCFSWMIVAMMSALLTSTTSGIPPFSLT